MNILKQIKWSPASLNLIMNSMGTALPKKLTLSYTPHQSSQNIQTNFSKIYFKSEIISKSFG